MVVIGGEWNGVLIGARVIKGRSLLFLNSRMAERRGEPESCFGECHHRRDRLSPCVFCFPTSADPYYVAHAVLNIPTKSIYADQPDQPRASCPPNRTAAWAVLELGVGVYLAGVSVPVFSFHFPPVRACRCFRLASVVASISP